MFLHNRAWLKHGASRPNKRGDGSRICAAYRPNGRCATTGTKRSGCMDLATITDMALHGCPDPPEIDLGIPLTKEIQEFIGQSKVQVKARRLYCDDPRIDWDEALRYTNGRYDLPCGGVSRANARGPTETFDRLAAERTSAVRTGDGTGGLSQFPSSRHDAGDDCETSRQSGVAIDVQHCTGHACRRIQEQCLHQLCGTGARAGRLSS